MSSLLCFILKDATAKEATVNEEPKKEEKAEDVEKKEEDVGGDSEAKPEASKETEQKVLICNFLLSTWHMFVDVKVGFALVKWAPQITRKVNVMS